MATQSEDKTKNDEPGSGRGAQLRQQTDVVREDIRKLGHLARGAAQEKIEEVRDRASEVYDRGRARATEAYERGKVKASEVEDQLVDYVRAKPIKAMLLAAGVGAFIGILWARR